tara:strand:- start:445 stop:1023 length:579 start_codon:yes stop_codon:yes gene_type:complete
MSFTSQDNQNLLWELIAESGLLHTVADRIPMVQQQFQSKLMKYQYDSKSLTEKNKLVIQDMIQYIKSFQSNNETSESLQQQRMNTLQENMNIHENHFKQYALPKKVEEIDFSDPTPDPNSYTPIQQVLDSQQLKRNSDNKLDIVIQDINTVKKTISDIQEQVNQIYLLLSDNKTNTETSSSPTITFTTTTTT